MENSNYIEEYEFPSFLEMLKRLNSNEFGSFHIELISNFLNLNNQGSFDNVEFEKMDFRLSKQEKQDELREKFDNLFYSSRFMGDLLGELSEQKMSYCDIFYSNYELNSKILQSIFFRLDEEITIVKSRIKQFEDEEFESIKKIDEEFVSLSKVILSNHLLILEWFISEFHFFIPNFNVKNEINKSLIGIDKFSENTSELLSGKHKRTKGLTNHVKLKSIEEFCPELIQRLHNCNKEEKKDVIHLITGVNRDDSYKLLFTSDKRQINETSIDIDGIDFETLKNKLKNTHLSK
jgi:hypothetical protein